MKNKFIFFPVLIIPFFTVAQNLTTDTSFEKNNLLTAPAIHPAKKDQQLARFKSMIIPVTLVSYGFAALGHNYIQSLNLSTKSELQEDHPAFVTKADNYMQYLPAVTVYGLNAAGVKGKNNFRDRTMIYLLSTAISGVTVTSLKHLIKVTRPDGSNNQSFPSGHTATAFAAAEFLRMEYKSVSPWFGVAGYATAAATGILRLYNNKHWVNDVVAGAGFGILSTRVSYWIYPVIKKAFFKEKKVNSMVVPFYHEGNAGLCAVYNF